jgi:glycosyltransferase involved in cell wall biosynthesis
MSNKRCIIIPAFNEEKNIPSVIESLAKFCSADIVVIDDGSTDRTSANAKKAGAHVVRHPFNLGYGVALQTGYKYASENNYDYLLQIDGDGQHDPSYTPEMFAKVEGNECDIVIGSRFLKNNLYKPGFLKIMAIKLFRLIIKIITGEKITDPTSGYQCMNRRVLIFFTDDSFPCDYPDANIIIILHRMGFKIMEMPVKMIANPEGRSMHRGIFNIMYYFFKIFFSIFVILIRKKYRYRIY